MTDWKALNEAVLADLDSDEPRLVLADALQAAGDPRGELIAVQCELARLGCERTRLATWKNSRFGQDPEWLADLFATGDPARRRGLRERERALLREHVAGWTAGLPDFTRIERGFVAHIDGYHGNPVSLFDRAPTLESLELELITSGIELVTEPRVHQLRQLRLSLSGPGPDRTAIGRLLGELEQLRQLAIYGAVELPSAALQRLEALDLGSAHQFTRPIEHVLAEMPRLRHLRLTGETGPLASRLRGVAPQLDIFELVMTSADIAPLVTDRLALRVLRVSEFRIDAFREAARAIGAGLPALQLLDLGGTPLDPFVPELVSGSGLTALTHLRLQRCGIGDRALEALARSPLLGRLRHLDLRNNPITDSSIDALGAATNLEVLELHRTKLSSAGIQMLRERLPETAFQGPVFYPGRSR